MVHNHFLKVSDQKEIITKIGNCSIIHRCPKLFDIYLIVRAIHGAFALYCIFTEISNGI